MSDLAKKFLAVLMSISVVFISILLFGRDSNEREAVVLASRLVSLPGISLSTSYVGDRIPSYSDFSNEFYFGVKKDSFASFIYVK